MAIKKTDYLDKTTFVIVTGNYKTLNCNPTEKNLNTSDI